MSTPYMIGLRTPTLMLVKSSFDPARGMVVTEQYAAPTDLGGTAAVILKEYADSNKIEGEEETDVVAEFGVYGATGTTGAVTPLAGAAQGRTFELWRNGVTYNRLTVKHNEPSGIPEVVTVTWQLIASQIQKDIKEHPTVRAMPRTYADEVGFAVGSSLQAVLDAVKNFQEGIPPPAIYGYGGSTTQAQLFKLMTHGVTSYAIDAHVARRTVNVTATSAGSGVNYGVPPAIQPIITGLAVGITDGMFTWGWRRTGYQYNAAANNRVEITTEWALAAWSVLLYPTGVGALA